MQSRHRFVLDEPEVPFELTILYKDENIIVVDKPHFLATTPRGMWYRQTALIRLRERFEESQITPAHRLDRLTAGVVLFVRNPALRRDYQMLFQEHRVMKTYECLAPSKPVIRPKTGTVERLDPPAVFPLKRRSHIVKDRGRLQAYEIPGVVNAETVIELADTIGNDGADALSSSGGNDVCNDSRHQHLSKRGTVSHSGVGLVGPYRRYVLHPRTGKTHQLRVHMNSLGLPIKGDDLYPNVIEPNYSDFSHPLQLVARSLSFIDPVSQEPCMFVSRVPLV
ncbi:pseudouridine synthase [Bifidobacterium sp. ESL0682]|uniref:pseudouridine synthase n=1 Tax=Bifidobacterium sp. ESL0682 TaxID=2983212 RepID=UPI0023F7F56C|nr:pseudouridine synthase [Bifidobacterium sp. ESL0682]WEV42457.1 pseudouridine synthase [Bifidobacterium sp. ESL0682]